MVSLADMFMQGGPFMYVVVLFAIIGATVAMLGGALGLARVRVPAILWLGAPLLTVTAGAAGELLGLQQAADAIAFASPDTRATLAHAGASVAAMTTTFAMLMSSLLLGMSAWLAALPSAVAPGEGAKTTALTALAGAALAGITGLGLLGWVFPDFGAAALIGATLVFLSPALLIGGARVGSGEEDRARCAEARVSVALCAVGAVACAGAYAYLSGASDGHRALALASAETRMTLLAMGRQQQQIAATGGAVGALVAAVAGLIAAGPLLGAAVSGRTIASVVAAGAGLLFFGAAEGGVLYYRTALEEAWSTPELVGIHQRLPDMPVPQDLDGEETYGDSIHPYDFIVTWPQGAQPEPTPPLPCIDGEIPAVAVATSASTTVSELVSQPWCAGSAQIDILLAPNWIPDEARGDPLMEPLFLATTPALWQSAAVLDAAALAQLHQDETTLLLYEKGGRVVIHQAHLQPVVVPSLRAAAEDIQARLDADTGLERLAVGPASWSVQELVGLMGTVNRQRGSYAVGLELLAHHTPPAMPASGRGSANNGGAGDTEVIGNLSQDEIRRVFRRHVNQIRYCYERELTKDPSLAGRIEVKLVIGQDGSVASAQVERDTMRNDAVATCIVGRIKRFRFPPPEGGGIVVVRYPFVFSSE